MLSNIAPALANGASAPLALLVRSISTSVRALEAMPSYIYMPPGSSISDPSYQHGGGAAEGGPAQHGLPDSKSMRPSRKAAYLRLTTRRSPLESQQQPGAMLPPGCSMSDPHYSIRDPVYFVEGQQ